MNIIYWIKILLPLLISFPFLFSIIKLDSKKPVSECLGVTIITAGWWILESFPLAATSLVPVVLFPFFKIVDGNKVAGTMFSDTILVMLSGFFISAALIKTNLHSRIAIKTILLVGMRAKIFLFGVCAITFFLSMWISNTSTCLTMVPNVMAVLNKLEEMGNSAETSSLFTRAVLMGITTSSTLGGLATIVGTPVNLVLVQVLEKSFPKAPELTFGKYFLVSFPVSFILFLIMYFCLVLYYLKNLELKDLPESEYENKYKALGPMSFSEIVVSILFLLMAILWFWKSDLEFGNFKIKGWTTLLLGNDGEKFIKDGTIGIAITIFLFLIQSPIKNNMNNSILLTDLIEEEKSSNTEYNNLNEIKKEPIITWEYSMEQCRWDILFIMAGGFILNLGFQSSGLDVYIGSKLGFFMNWNIFILVFVISFIISWIGSIMSNAACASIFVPIVGNMAIVSQKINPLLLMLVTTWSCSFGLYLPIASPMNMIVMGTGKIFQKDFLIVGSIINLVGLIVMTFVAIPLANYFLGTDKYPDWAK